MKEPNIEEALKVPGFMNGYELYWLALQAQASICICEVGSWKGRTSLALLHNRPAEGRVFCIDTWDSSPELKHISDEMAPDALFNEFMENVKETGVIALRMNSHQGATYLKFLHEKFSLIFLDGDHTYEAVKQDIEDYLPLVFKGGCLCGHDYKKAEGVKKAVDELIPNRVLPLSEWGDIWAVTI